MSTAITPIMPVMDIEAAVSRRNAMVEYVQRIMVSGVDYGTIPGTGSKPTLLKPGAEKLASMFALRPSFPIVEAVQDWTGVNHGGEPFFSYWYKCILWRGDESVGEGDASCNSWEKKYRYRKAERACPNCGALSVSKSKYAPKNDPNGQPGWYCRDCKAQFPANDPGIKDQALGYVANTDVADQVNTLQKMAQKRALIAAILVTCNASEFFTQDLEDMVDAEYHEVTKPDQKDATVATITGNGKPQPAVEPMPLATPAQLKRLNQIGSQFYGAEWDTMRHDISEKLSKGRTKSSRELTKAEADAFIKGVERKLDAKEAEAAAKVAATPAPTNGDQAALLEEAAAANDHSSWGAQAL